MTLIIKLLYLATLTHAQNEQVKMYLDSSYFYETDKIKADSFAKLALNKSKLLHDDIGQFKSLKALGSNCDYHNELKCAYDYYTQAIPFAKKAKLEGEIFYLYLYMGSIKEDLGNREEAIALTHQSLAIAKLLNDSIKLGRSYHALGSIRSNEGNHEKAAQNYLTAITYVEHIKDHHIYGSICQGIGIVYNKQNDFDKAESYFKKVYSHFENQKDTSGMIPIMNDFGILHKNKGNFDQSEYWYLKILELSKKDNFFWAKPYAITNLATLYYNMGDFEKGISYSQQAVEIHQKSGVKRSESDALNYLAKSQLGLAQYRSAIENAKRSVQLARQANVLEKERDALLTLSNAYEKTNQEKLALQIFKEHKTVYDSIYNLSKSEQIHGLEEKYQKAQKDQEIAIMKKSAELDKIKNTRLWIGLGLTILFSGLLFWFQLQKRKREKLILEEKQKVVDLENQRLSQELDFKNQQLTSKVLQLCRKNEFLKSLNKKVQEIEAELSGADKNKMERLSRQIDFDMQTDQDWEQFLKLFESVHPEFKSKINELHSSFSKGEIRMASLLKMNLSTKDISNLLNITIAGVKKTRNRMRKKMNIDQSVDLANYFMTLGS